MNGARHSLVVRLALLPPEALFRLAVRVRNAWYDRPGRAHLAGVPVLSVGNLAVGGTGKTPLVAWLAKYLLANGFNPAIVSRGYGGNAGPGPLVVSSGSGPRVDARACGDEPVLLARTVPRAIVVVGADRVEGARAAVGLGASLVLLDDGFQHRRLARNLDLVLLDGRAPFGDGHLLPAGSLREAPAALTRAGVVVLTRLAPDDLAQRAQASVRAAGFTGPIVRAGHVARGFFANDGREAPPPTRAVVYCAIGDPERFRTDLAAAGVRVERFHKYRDHHVLTAPERKALAAEARALGVPLVMTEKDLAREDGRGEESWVGLSVLALRIEARVWDEARLLAAVRKALSVPARIAP